MVRMSRWSAVVVAAVLVLAGCSGSDSDDEGAGAGNDPGANPAQGGAGGSDGSDAVTGLTDHERAHLVEDGETTWDVTYTEDTTLVEGSDLDALVASDRSSGTFTFDADAADDAGLDLREGRVLLVAGQALGHITDVDEDDGERTVTIEPASLADVIEDGTVAWDVPIRFDFDQFVTEPDADRDDEQASGTDAGPATRSTPIASAAPAAGRAQLAGIAMRHPDGRIVPIQSGDEVGEAILDSIEVKPEDGAVEWTYESDENKYQFRLTAKGDSVDILVVVSRGGDDPTMAFRGEGTIESLRSVSSSSYEGGELTGSDVALEELASDFDLSVSVAGTGISPVDFTVPVPMLTYIWMVGPVPVTVDISADIIGNVNVNLNASATAKSSFRYRGDAGFSFEGTSVEASGSTAIDEMDPDPADSAAPMGIDVDAQFGLAFPSISLSLFGQGLIPNIHAGAVIGSRLEWGGPAAGFPASSLCKSAYVRMEVAGGYDLKILGHTLAEEKFSLYADEKRTQQDNCPEDD